jgi:hypothetical protein
MECPHCRSEITANPHNFALGEDKDGAWQVSTIRCATCDHLVVSLGNKGKPEETYPILPQGACRARLSSDIPLRSSGTCSRTWLQMILSNRSSSKGIFVMSTW